MAAHVLNPDTHKLPDSPNQATPLTMKIALFHNYYKQPGGEDTMFELEIEALRAHGHEVLPYAVRNSETLSKNNLSQKIRTALNAPHSYSSEIAISKFLAKHRPDISHVHNWFPNLSPSIFTAHHDAGVPIVQTLHNYRLACAGGNYQRNGQSCQACRPGYNLPAIRHRCYKNSTAGSIAWKRIMDRGWQNGTFRNLVSHYISPSREVRRKHIEMGIAPQQITHVPNACPDPRSISRAAGPNHSAAVQSVCFVGRFVAEKGAHILVRAWQKLSSAQRRQRRLILIGTGPQEAMLHELAAGDDSIHFTGQLKHQATLRTLQQADLLVSPSLWAEPFGLSVIEAMGAGIPVISSQLGGPAEVISDGIDGHLLPPGDIDALSKTLQQCLNAPEQLQAMGRAARLKYVQHYSPHRHAQQLTDCFQQVLTPGQTRATATGTPAEVPASAFALNPSV